MRCSKRAFLTIIQHTPVYSRTFFSLSHTRQQSSSHQFHKYTYTNAQTPQPFHFTPSPPKPSLRHHSPPFPLTTQHSSRTRHEHHHQTTTLKPSPTSTIFAHLRRGPQIPIPHARRASQMCCQPSHPGPDPPTTGVPPPQTPATPRRPGLSNRPNPASRFDAPPRDHYAARCRAR